MNLPIGNRVGEITYFKREKKYGFIRDTESDREFFFMASDVALDPIDILAGTPVTFKVKKDVNPSNGNNTLRAYLVRLR